jgi:hypothetical protein
MGIKYQIRDKNGKVVIRTKEAWPKYKRKRGFSLHIWFGAGKGWGNIQTSSYGLKKSNNN